MPNMSSHMSIAKRVSDLLNIKDKDFIIGNLLPDLEENKRESHYKIQGKQYLIPDIEYVKNNLDLTDMKNLGILTHLLLDKYYLEEYLYSNCPNDNVFEGISLYKDYDILNKDIVKYFDLDVDYLKEVLLEIDTPKYQDKLMNNINCLYHIENGETTYLDKDDFIKFLDNTSMIIAKEVKTLLDNINNKED